MRPSCVFSLTCEEIRCHMCICVLPTEVQTLANAALNQKAHRICIV